MGSNSIWYVSSTRPFRQFLGLVGKTHEPKRKTDQHLASARHKAICSLGPLQSLILYLQLLWELPSFPLNVKHHLVKMIQGSEEWTMCKVPDQGYGG